MFLHGPDLTKWYSIDYFAYFLYWAYNALYAYFSINDCRNSRLYKNIFKCTLNLVLQVLFRLCQVVEKRSSKWNIFKFWVPYEAIKLWKIIDKILDNRFSRFDVYWAPFLPTNKQVKYIKDKKFKYKCCWYKIDSSMAIVLYYTCISVKILVFNTIDKLLE